MANDTVTIVLSGEVTISRFDHLIHNFSQLIEALQREVAGTDAEIKWLVDHLDRSSAVATVRGVPGEGTLLEQVERVVRSYAEVGQALEKQQDVPFSPAVAVPARRIARLVDHDVEHIRFETAEADATIRAVPVAQPYVYYGAYGGIEGRVQTLMSRGSLRFTLYDLLYDRAVSCYLSEDGEDLMRDVWGRLALVEGMVYRDPVGGRPTSVRRVSNVTLLPERDTEHSFRDARGAAPQDTSGLSPEDAIRRVRDA